MQFKNCQHSPARPLTVRFHLGGALGQGERQGAAEVRLLYDFAQLLDPQLLRIQRGSSQNNAIVGDWRAARPHSEFTFVAFHVFGYTQFRSLKQSHLISKYFKHTN